VEPTAAAVDGASTTLTVTGSGFSGLAGENHVWVGERSAGGSFYATYAEVAAMSACVVTNASATQLVCAMYQPSAPIPKSTKE
jgi:hypothetical protein